MKLTGVPSLSRNLAIVAACVLLAAILSACASEGHDVATSEKVLVLEAQLHSLEESLDATAEENTALHAEMAAIRERNDSLENELAVLRQEQADYVEAREAAEAAREHEEEVAGFEEGQEEQITALEEDQALTGERLDKLESRLQGLEEVASQVEWILPSMQKWFENVEKRLTILEGTSIERAARLAESGGGTAQVINFGAAYGDARSAVLALPDPLPEIEIPLIVSLHGYGGDPFTQSLYIPLHERVNSRLFALLTPEGSMGPESKRFWNATDGCCGPEGTTVDDVAALTALVEEVGGEFNMGPVFFFGHSNGGFMSYSLACRGLPGLRVVASLAGTGDRNEEDCVDPPPVSVLHIHGTEDATVRFQGRDQRAGSDEESGLKAYAGAIDMVQRWAERAGCKWPEAPEFHATLDLDGLVPGAETHAYRLSSGCAEGVTIELWVGEGSGHIPGYGVAFVDALLDWLLVQQ